MINLHDIKSKVKARLGELWWYTVVLFMVQQLGAIINAFIGLWLVPRYVHQEELGVVLPLTSIGSLLGLPLSILMIPFMKFLSKYMAKEEHGKVKALLWDAFIFSGLAFLLVSGLSYFCIPLIFKRLRVEAGWLPFLVICSGIVGALAPVFSTALQAFKKYKTLSLMGTAGALLRLITLMITLPIRGLSGYFVGQIVPSVFTIIGTLYFLKKYLRTEIKKVSYWNEDIKQILQYTGWFALFYLFSLLAWTTENFIIRQRLPNIESAGYYMVSRFSDIVISLGTISASVLFPLIAEKHEKNLTGRYKMLLQSFWMLLAGGVLVSIMMASLAYILFSLNSEWNVYLQYLPHMGMLCAISIIRGMTNCYVMYEMARNRFKFVIPFTLFYLSEIGILFVSTGFSFFAPWISSHWVRSMESFNPCRLQFIIIVMLVASCVNLGYVVFQLFRNNDSGPDDYLKEEAR
jgi:O-antigen/teichoic acid export membrane protein